jgi:hypothetical protein
MLEHKIVALEEKVSTLVEKYNQALQDNKSLRERNLKPDFAFNEKIDRPDITIVQKFQNLDIIGDDKEELKKELEYFILEIDKCIDWLKNF